MHDSITPGGLSPQRDSFVPKKSNSIKAYLLECKLRQVLDENISPDDYNQLHHQTGIARLKLAEAIEDRVFLLDRFQLEHCLDLFGEKGLIPLIKFLHQPCLILPSQPEVTEPQSLTRLLAECPRLEELGYPAEVIEEWCAQHDLQARQENGDWTIHPDDLLSIYNSNH